MNESSADAASGRRRYDSIRRQQTAQETRANIAHAARAVFLSRGWAATTVRDVAEEAGVSVPTVYSAYGGKTALALALADSADLTAGADRMLEHLEAAGASPQDQLAAMVAYDRRLFENSGDLIRLGREAARDEPALEEVYRQRRRLADDIRVQIVKSWPEEALRSGMSAADAADVYAALCNIDVYTTLVTERGWSPERIEQWWGEAVARELLANP